MVRGLLVKPRLQHSMRAWGIPWQYGSKRASPLSTPVPDISGGAVSGTAAGLQATDGDRGCAGSGGGAAVEAPQKDATPVALPLAAAGNLAADAEALVDSLATEFGSASLQDEQMQSLVCSLT